MKTAVSTVKTLIGNEFLQLKHSAKFLALVFLFVCCNSLYPGCYDIPLVVFTIASMSIGYLVSLWVTSVMHSGMDSRRQNLFKLHFYAKQTQTKLLKSDAMILCAEKSVVSCYSREGDLSEAEFLKR